MISSTHARDLGGGKPEITVAPPSFVGEQPRVDQLCQMRARGLRGHMCHIGEFAGAQRAAVHQRRQHVRARRVANQRGDLGDVGSVCHDRSIARGAGGPAANASGPAEVMVGPPAGSSGAGERGIGRR